MHLLVRAVLLVGLLVGLVVCGSTGAAAGGRRPRSPARDAIRQGRGPATTTGARVDPTPRAQPASAPNGPGSGGMSMLSPIRPNTAGHGVVRG